jgi:hypothetical protein
MPQMPVALIDKDQRIRICHNGFITGMAHVSDFIHIRNLSASASSPAIGRHDSRSRNIRASACASLFSRARGARITGLRA